MLHAPSARRLMLTLCPLLMLSAAPRAQAAAPADPDTAWVPLTITQEGLPSIPVDVAGKPGRMVLDTGAGSTVLFEDALAKLDVRPVGAVPVQGAAAHGEALVYRLRALVAAGRSRPLAPLALRRPGPLEGIDGILGADWLAGSVLDVDAPNGRVAIRQSAAAAARGGVGVPFRQRARILLFAGKLNGHDVTLVLDSGAATSVANARAAELGMAGSDAVEQHRSIGGAAGSQRAGGSVRPLGTLSAGDHVFRKNSFFVADLPVFRSLGLAETPAIIVGFDQLQSERFIVDYTSNIIIFFAQQ